MDIRRVTNLTMLPVRKSVYTLSNYMEGFHGTWILHVLLT